MADRADRLRLLHAVAGTGSIAGAARRVGYTPSAVSQQLATLEREVGVSLLERSNRGVQLTAAGTEMVERASVILDLLDGAFAEAERRGGTPARAPIRVAAFPTAVSAVLVPLMAQTTQPVTVVHSEPAAALAALLDRQVDLAIVDDYDVQPEPMQASLEGRLLLTDALRLVTSTPDLAATTWVLGSATSGLGRVGRLICHRMGFAPRVIAETDDHRLAFAIIAACGGATVQPGLTLGDLPPGVQAAATAVGVTRRIHLVQRRVPLPDPAVQRVVEALQMPAASA